MLPLFTSYPALARSLPHLALGEFPTPVERLAGMERMTGRRNLFVKRDDMSGTVYGGNKVRKLEFLLAGAIESGASRVLTAGAAGSNHALATALYAREAGLKAVLLLSGQPNSPGVRANLLMDITAGAEVVYEEHYGNFTAMIDGLVEKYRRLDGRSPYVIPAGGSSPVGVIGYVNAAFELKEQIDRGVLPEPGAIYIPVGTMGTAAGLLLGLKAAGLRSRLVAVRVAPAALATSDKLLALVKETHGLLQKRDTAFPRVSIAGHEAALCNDFFEPGYGLASPEVKEAVAAAEAGGGMRLDTTYSGKAFAAFVKEARRDKSGGEPLLFWNTKNSRPFPEGLMAADYRALPKPLQRYFEV